MKQKVFAILLALVLVLTMAVPASADFGGAGNMISPAVLELIPRDGVANRSWASPARFTWSYAPLFFKPDERETSSAEGPAPTDPETDTASEHLKLQGPTACRLYWNSGWSPESAGATPVTDLRMISTSGIKMIPTMLQKLGSLDSSISSCVPMRSGTGIIYLFPQYLPNIGPATIIAAVPQKIPIRITHPRSTPSIVATRTGPGVGGMKACPTASPARSGIA